jgi:hypothetical protein
MSILHGRLPSFSASAGRFYTELVTIGYLEAWRVWFGGQEVNPHARLWFMSVLWSGRAGKIASFIGGATVILDLIGPERLRQFALTQRERRARKLFDRRKSSHWVLVIIVMVLGAGSWLAILSEAFENQRLSGFELKFLPVFELLPVAMVLILLIRVITFLVQEFSRLAARVLDTERPAQTLRYVAVGLLAVGFHFDLLAS